MEDGLHINVTETFLLNKMNIGINGVTWNDVTFSDLNLHLQKKFHLFKLSAVWSVIVALDISNDNISSMIVFLISLNYVLFVLLLLDHVIKSIINSVKFVLF